MTVWQERLVVLSLFAPVWGTDGSVVINEIMQNPSAVADDDGEWFELYNGDTVAYDLRGWTIADLGTDRHLISGEDPVMLEPGGYLVLGREADTLMNGGVMVDYEYSGFRLTNSGDAIIVIDEDSSEVDRVVYDGGPEFPNPTGASMALLDPGLDNNDGASWTESAAPFGSGDLGTPGTYNFPYVGPVWYVDGARSDTVPDGSPGSPFPSVQAGIDAAREGDTVLVLPGVYRENLTIRRKNLVISSLFVTDGNRSHISGTIIDGGSRGSTVTFEEVAGRGGLLTGFTLRNGYALRGGGIHLVNSHPVISHCYVEDNVAEFYGGGIFMTGSSPIISSCIIRTNRIGSEVEPAFSGAALYCLDSAPRIEACTITGNVGSVSGGLTFDRSDLLMVNCTVSGNHGFTAGGLYGADGSRLVVANSILWENLPREIVFGADGDSSLLAITHSNVSGGKGAAVTNDNARVIWLDGNIDVDPLFADPEGNDFTLQVNSPCIDGGTPLFVWSGDTLINLPLEAYVGQAPDMGSFEFGSVSVAPSNPRFPSGFALEESYPNPFNPRTTIPYYLPTRVRVKLEVYDLLGRPVATLVDRIQSPGSYDTQWDGSTRGGERAGAGIYVIRISVRSHTAGEWTASRKVILLK